MDKHEKLYQFILMRRSDANVPFLGLCTLLKRLGFEERVKGDHHIFTMEGLAEILNLQPRGSKAKPYQVKQVRDVILRYGLMLGEQK
ncbi:MAG: type II toxin-antitoxin system HicA family toxin [Planctomycetota bacterium]